MNTDELRLFLVLMSERSVSRAAERLGISQPAASHGLARLRVLFDDPLLLRSGNRLAGTPRALELEPEVRRLVGDWERLVAPLRTFDPARDARTFVVTATEYAETLVVPAMLRRLRAGAPNVRIEVRAPDPARASDLLANGELDLRIAWITSPAPSLRAMQLFEDRLVCIVDQGHPSVHGRITLEQFTALPHARTLGTHHTTSIRVVDEAVARLGRRLAQSFLVQHFSTIPAMIVGTDVVATLPRTRAMEFAARYPLQVLDPPLRLPRVRYAAYWHERSHNEPAHRWLRQQLREVAREVQPRG